MSFAQTLHQIVEDCGGGVAAVLIGRDGLPIEQVESPDPERSGLLADIGVAGVEFGRLVEEARKASDALDAGPPRECVFVLHRLSIVVHAVDAETYVVLALAPDGNLGKARYLLRRYGLAIREEL
jgi:predicted regulator of Ras-like GTPase activity (Roadblock/LC7/MglB family)